MRHAPVLTFALVVSVLATGGVAVAAPVRTVGPATAVVLDVAHEADTGRALVVWSRGDGAGTERLELLREDASGRLRRVRQLAATRPRYSDEFPFGAAQVATTPAGDPVAAWYERTVLRGFAGGRTATLDPDTQYELDDFDLAADPDGTAVVAFPGPDGLSVAERAPGAPFAAISAVSRAKDGVAQAATDGRGGAVVAVADIRGRVTAAIREPGGSFGRAQTLRRQGRPARSLALALAPTGRAVAAWGYGSADGGSVEAAERPAGAPAFAARRTLTPPDLLADAETATAVAERDGTVTVAWQEVIRGPNRAQALRWAPGAGPGAPRRVWNRGPDQDGVRALLTDAGRVKVVFRASVGRNGGRYLAGDPLGARRPTVLTPPNVISEPAFAAGPRGLLTVWNRGFYEEPGPVLLTRTGL